MFKQLYAEALTTGLAAAHSLVAHTGAPNAAVRSAAAASASQHAPQHRQQWQQ